jgi:uncharacterized protein YndB with AHSA1/START domain
MATLTGFQQDNTGAYIEKDPNAKLTYTVNWVDWLPTSQTISASTWTLETDSGDGYPLVNHGISNTTTTASIIISGGSDGDVYKVYNQITTSGGSIERRYFRLRVKERSL